MSAVDRYFVGYGPERIEDITVHDGADGSAVIETVTSRSVRVFDKTDGLRELHGDAKTAALEAFWADFNEIDNNGGDDR